MDKQLPNPDKIISRLKTFDYDYDLNGTTLKIYLPMFCYLKINYKSDKIRITSHISLGFSYFPIEINFLIYGLFFYCLTWFQWANLNKGIFALFGIMLFYFIVCFIKLESLRSILHTWIEKESHS